MGMVLIFTLLSSFLTWQSIASVCTSGPRLGSWSLAAITSLDSLPKPTSNDLPLSIYILYFDQSSPQLRPGVKITLDSLARQLVGQPTWMATVTGYTDNVGKRELNLALAEYRAKTVETYLKQRGVRADQIKAEWEGPDKNARTEGAEAVKTISRRVVVQLSPK